METTEEGTAIRPDADDCPVAVVVRPLRPPLLNEHTGAGAEAVNTVGPIGPLRKAHRIMAFGCQEMREGTFETMVTSQSICRVSSWHSEPRLGGVSGRSALRAPALWDSPRFSINSSDKGLEKPIWGARIHLPEASCRGVVQLPR